MIEYTPKYLKQKAAREARIADGLPMLSEKDRAKNAERYQKRKAAGLVKYTHKPKTEAQKNWKPTSEKSLATRAAYTERKNAERRAAYALTKTPDQIAELDRRRETRAERKKEYDKKRSAARSLGKPDTRTKEGRTKPHYKTVQAESKVAKETRLPQSPKQTALRKERKPRAQAAVCKINPTPEHKVKVYIKELKGEFFLEPGQSVTEVIAKYTARASNKIPKW